MLNRYLAVQTAAVGLTIYYFQRLALTVLIRLAPKHQI